MMSVVVKCWWEFIHTNVFLARSLPLITDTVSPTQLCQVVDHRCRGSSATPFQFILIIDCQPHPTPYCWCRAFPVDAVHVWNSLPDLVTSAPSVAVFLSRLKTHLFNISYLCDCTVPAQWLYCFGHYSRSCLLKYLQFQQLGTQYCSIYRNS